MNWFYKKIANRVIDVLDVAIEERVDKAIKERFAISTKHEKILFTRSQGLESEKFFKFIDQVKVTKFEVSITRYSSIGTYSFENYKVNKKDVYGDLHRYLRELDIASTSGYYQEMEIKVHGVHEEDDNAYKSFDIIKRGKYKNTTINTAAHKFAEQLNEIVPEFLI